MYSGERERSKYLPPQPREMRRLSSNTEDSDTDESEQPPIDGEGNKDNQP